MNGVPIELGRAGVIIDQPSTYHTFLARVDHRLGDSDNLTVRYHYNKREDTDQISNCNFGPTFCGSQDLKDTNLALSETHIFGPSVVNEFRFSWVQRDLLFPENDPAEPHRDDQRALHDRRRQQLPAVARERRLPVLERHDLDEEQALDQARRRRPLQQDGQPGGVRLEGHVHLQQPAVVHEQRRRAAPPGAADGELAGEPVAGLHLRG